MRWRKRKLLKAGIVVAGILLLLVLMTWVPVSAARAFSGVTKLAMPGTITVQTTPTEDATVTALNKEKLAQEVQQLKEQNEPDFFGWFRMNASILLSTLVVVIGGLIGLWRWLGDRRSEREKRAEERFQAVVEGFGSEREEARVGAVIMLRTFLRPSYEQFYMQTFDLTVANLRLPRTSHVPENPVDTSHPSEDLETPLPLTTLRQALIAVFKEVFPLVRQQQPENPTAALDASSIQLDNAFLLEADLQGAWIPQASIRNANLSYANLSSIFAHKANFTMSDLSNTNLWGASLSMANFRGADLTGANLRGVFVAEGNFTDANLTGADLSKDDDPRLRRIGARFLEANFTRANLSRAILSRVDLSGANFSGAHLNGANLSGAKLSRVDPDSIQDFTRFNLRRVFSEAEHSGADFNGADLSKANLSGADLNGVDLEVALSLKGTNLHGAKGLTKKQLAACTAKGAVIDGDSTANPSEPL